MDLGSSTELITLRPWSTGKQLPLGLSVFDQGDTVTLLQRVMALAKELERPAGANSQANQGIVAGSDPVSVLTTAVESFKK